MRAIARSARAAAQTTACAFASSRLAVGSSAMTTAGLRTSARASATRCAWPRLSSCGRRRAELGKLQASTARRRTALRSTGARRTRTASARLPATLRLSLRCRRCGMKPSERPRHASRWPRRQRRDVGIGHAHATGRGDSSPASKRQQRRLARARGPAHEHHAALRHVDIGKGERRAAARTRSAGRAARSRPAPPRSEGLAELLDLRRDDERAVALVGLLLEVALVVAPRPGSTRARARPRSPLSCLQRRSSAITSRAMRSCSALCV